MEFDRTIVTFFILFSVVFFLESIGGFYMTSAIVSIEKQFQIPSKISGLMVSAGDFGYIPSIVFVSYLGGKGNRAKWIGGGCVLIAIANLLISASNFLFPVETISLNNTILSRTLERDTQRLKPNNANFEKFLFDLTPEVRAKIQLKFGKNSETVTPGLMSLTQNYEETWLEKFNYCDKMNSNNITDVACDAFYSFLLRHNSASKEDVDNLRMLSGTTYAFCDAALNQLRSMIQQIRCKKGVSYFGPTATIFIGLLFLGVGRTMPFSLGLPLIDDNVKKQNLPVYFAGMFFIRIMGPVIGFMMGSFFNKFYYTPNPPQGITPRDPMWIGMWWGGFLVIGTVLFGPSVGLFCFKAPTYEDNENEEKAIQKSSKLNKNEYKESKSDDTEKKLLSIDNPTLDVNNAVENPVKKKTRTKLALVDRHLELNEEGDALMPSTIKAKITDFVGTISTVITQPIYVGSIVGRIIDVMAFKGFYIFLPKYLEIQFGIPQYKINMYMGIIGVIGFAVGVLIGSVVMRVFKLEGRRIATWVAVCSGLAACLSFVNVSVGCRSTLTALGETVSSNFNVNNTCVANCGCEFAPLYPVCDQQGQVFYSPCHAGCKLDISSHKFLDKSKSPIFNQCKCTLFGTKVSRDFCTSDECDRNAKLYFGNMAISGIIGGMGVVPGVLIMLRSVPQKHRSVSLGFNGFLVSLLATLPSPIMWGTILDYFCIYWDKKCNGRGACSLYATDKLRVWLHSIYGTLRLIALLTDIYVVYHAKNLKISEELDENVTPKKDEKKNFSNLKENNQNSEQKLNEDSLSLQDDSKKGQHILSSTKKSSITSSHHTRHASRDLKHFSINGFTTNDLRKSSSHIAGPMTDL